MKISYAIPVCNELKEIQRLLNFLLKNKKTKDEIVILFDSTNGTSNVEEYLRAKSINGEFNWVPYDFDGHFANMKNKLTSLCSGDYIFQIDADEMISEYCLENLPLVLQYNSIDVLLVPRINTVEGLTQEHIQKWNWRINKEGWINFPDFQFRIYKNSQDINWKNRVHEVLEGFNTISELPLEEPWCLIHEKTIEKQEKQNAYYEKL
jgi:GT2 family glycosyltransferase